MPTFYYSQNQNPPPPPAYMQAAAPSAAANKWYDSNRTWGEWAQQWENYFGFGKKTEPVKTKKTTVEVHFWNQLPEKPDGLPYDHAAPFGVDPNDPSQPYAPHGFYCDKDGNPTTVPYVSWEEKNILKNELRLHPDDTDPASPLNVYNVESPMDPYNMQQFFYAEKPGSQWHQYERQPDEMAPWTKQDIKDVDPQWVQWEQPALPGYIKYPDSEVTFKDTPENFPWLHDQDPAHHYRNANHAGFYTYAEFSPFVPFVPFFFGPTAPQPNITKKIYLDSPVAPAGWTEVGSDVTPAADKSAVQ